MSETPLLLSVPADEVFVTMRGQATIVKDPAAVRYYGLDLTAWLAEVGEELASAVAEVSGITAEDTNTAGDPVVVLLPNDSTGSQKIAVRLSGGAEPASITFTFATVGGATDARRINFLIRER